VEASSGYGKRGSHSFEPKGYYLWLAGAPNNPLSCNILLRPLRIVVSKVAMKSVMTVSASCSPARTEMTSELGLVYFFARAASRKTVKVWPVSLGQCHILAASYLESDLV
jgi:hypothetical protein